VLRAENEWLRSSLRAYEADAKLDETTDSDDQPEQNAVQPNKPPLPPMSPALAHYSSATSASLGGSHTLGSIKESGECLKDASSTTSHTGTTRTTPNEPEEAEAEDDLQFENAEREAPPGFLDFWRRRRASLESERNSGSSSSLRQQTPGRSLARMICTQFEEMVQSMWFESFFAVLILLSTITTAIEIQAKGMDAGFDLSFDEQELEHPNAYTAVQGFLDVCEMIWGVLFTAEVVLKVLAMQVRFLRSLWNLFDAFIILFWLVDQASRAALPINPIILRICRLARLLRMLRLVKMVQFFDSLHLMIGAIRSSVSVLLWSMVLLCMTMAVCALCLGQVLQPYIANDENPEENRREIYAYFGTASRSLITMFELTLANWVPPCRALINNVNEWFGIVVLFYRIVVGFAVVNVINGVFMHETFKVASSNDEIMIIHRERAASDHVRKMKRLFSQADKDGDGVISKAEFLHLIQDRRVRDWLAAMELQSGDGEALFDLLANGQGELSMDVLITQVANLKGSARSIDLATLSQETGSLKRMIKEIDDKLRWSNSTDEGRHKAPRTRPLLDIMAPL